MEASIDAKWGYSKNNRDTRGLIIKRLQSLNVSNVLLMIKNTNKENCLFKNKIFNILWYTIADWPWVLGYVSKMIEPKGMHNGKRYLKPPKEIRYCNNEWTNSEYNMLFAIWSFHPMSILNLSERLALDEAIHISPIIQKQIWKIYKVIVNHHNDNNPGHLYSLCCTLSFYNHAP